MEKGGIKKNNKKAVQPGDVARGATNAAFLVFSLYII